MKYTHFEIFIMIILVAEIRFPFSFWFSLKAFVKGNREKNKMIKM